jgi:hypothetical protein
MAGMWKGVRKSLGGSSVSLIILGVELRVPHVIRCFTAAGPSSAGVGEGRLGTSENPCFLGELGGSVGGKHQVKGIGSISSQGVPVIAASMRLLVGLGGA